jgi:hypothetical protein
MPITGKLVSTLAICLFLVKLEIANFGVLTDWWLGFKKRSNKNKIQ